MNYIGSKTIETERLILKAESIKEQKRLWEILMIPNVNMYYLTIPSTLREKLKDWEKQESYYKESMKNANDKDVFSWSIFLKENNVCIGRIGFHERNKEDSSVNDPSIRGVGWYIDPNKQRKGYATEAATATIKYMFDEVGISRIDTGAAVDNPSSLGLMEKLGFARRGEKTYKTKYTFIDEPVDLYFYGMTREEYNKINS